MAAKGGSQIDFKEATYGNDLPPPKKAKVNSHAQTQVKVEDGARSITACKRCRSKKTKCDQKFPRCSKCEKANVECISVDPSTGRDIPRSYITHLEEKVKFLELKLKQFGDNDPQMDNGSNISLDGSDSNNCTPVNMIDNNSSLNSLKMSPSDSQRTNTISSLLDEAVPPSSERPRKHSILSRVENSTAISSSVAPPSFLGASSGIPFAKLMFTAVNFRAHDSPALVPTTNPALNSGSFIESSANSTPSMSQTFGRLPVVDPSMSRVKPTSTIAALPPKDVAVKFLSRYFAQSNSQLPVLHREEFLKKYFEPIYGSVPLNVSFASSYTQINVSALNQDIAETDTWMYKLNEIQKNQKEKETNKIIVPHEYRAPLYFLNIVFAIASSINHLQYPEHFSDGFKNSALEHMDVVYSSSDKLEVLQSVLLLTLYSVMRPAVPGVWYVLGSALRICVDLGLHTETSIIKTESFDDFTLDLRRRLFWCCYALDRQVCVYLGRPFGIPEESISVQFPSELDDSYIVRNQRIPDIMNEAPSYKSVSIAMFKVRKMQAEIQSILYELKELPRKFVDLNHWRQDISKRLENWRDVLPKTQRITNCDFNFQFFNLNYNHSKVMINGLSPGNLTPTTENQINVAMASKEIILSYYELYEEKLINYTWVAVHNLFMAGTSFLYSIYYCQEVRFRVPIKEIQQIALYCNLILTSLCDRCTAAVHCRDVFEILTAAVIKLRYTATIVNSPAGGANDGRSATRSTIIPSTSSIADSQPARHMTEHLKNLIASLPNTPSSILSSGGPATGSPGPLQIPNYFSTEPQPQIGISQSRSGFKAPGIPPPFSSNSLNSPRPLNGVVQPDRGVGSPTNIQMMQMNTLTHQIVHMDPASPGQLPSIETMIPNQLPVQMYGGFETHQHQQLQQQQQQQNHIQQMHYQRDASPFKWSTNEQELTRFFEELEKADSPLSIRSSSNYSENNSNEKSSFGTEGSNDEMIKQQYRNTNNASGPNSYAIDIVSNSHSSSDTPFSVSGSDAAYEALSSNNSPNGSYYVKNQKFQQQMTTFPQHSAQKPLFTSPHNQQRDAIEGHIKLENNSDGDMSNSSPVMRPFSNTSDKVSLSTKVPSTKEGQKIFKMIYQIPTESIWDQFFAPQYPSLDEEGPIAGDVELDSETR